jgi:hypothetical protein
VFVKELLACCAADGNVFGTGQSGLCCDVCKLFVYKIYVIAHGTYW